MLFNSLTFLAFFAVVLILHNLPLSWRTRKANLLVASYIFYAAWNPPFVVLLWVSTLVDWFVARRLAVTRRVPARRGLLLISLAANLGLLGFFKYGAFLTTNVIAFARLLGVHFQPLAPDIILPVGISFYTFQTLSYTLDVYSGKREPGKSFLDYALYVTFFPQLVAGPIVRAGDFLPQCEEPKRASAEQLGWGLSLLLLGLFEKVVVADGLLAPVSEQVYDPQACPGFCGAWTGTFAFAGQIFCDFAGYSSCAVGIALCLGFALPDNFRFPYAAIGFSDFWRRWHISLSTWLRDYLYIPMGGNRGEGLRPLRNLSVTMFLGGLWHGASWTFVLWGVLHGVYLAIERVLLWVVPRGAFWRRNPVRAGLALATFLMVCVGWVFFRARSLGAASAMLASMFGGGGAQGQPALGMGKVAVVLGITIGILLLHWLLRDSSLEALVARCPWWLRSLVLASLMIAIVTLSGEDRAFIYFQF
ncbi:MAG TPA: MBOAT family O-acyltransferase [Planctomycetota bacterium]|nr:MBOAT family O-acyltransferase [Planctomycetota bacterium]